MEFSTILVCAVLLLVLIYLRSGVSTNRIIITITLVLLSKNLKASYYCYVPLSLSIIVVQPIRGLVIGPPAVGKTTVVKQLCERYKLHHLTVKDVINDAMEALQRSSARTDVGEEEEDDGKAQEDQELLDAINESKEEDSGRIGENYVLRFMKEKMRSKPCQNQGFILDGYPKTMEQARDLFASMNLAL